MILIDALYINQSGGKVLLTFLIETLARKGRLSDYFFLIDHRLKSDACGQINSENKLILVANTKNRHHFYTEHQDRFGVFFCFANIPPPITIAKPVFIFFHNALLLSSNGVNYGRLDRLKFLVKRLYIRSKNRKHYQWLVQTQTMQEEVALRLKIDRDKIKVLPIYEDGRFAEMNKQLPINRYNYLYVADGVKQKNHEILLKAWEVLASRTDHPLTLHLTIAPHFKYLIDEINRLKDKGCLIINHGLCNFEQLAFLYANCNYFVSPSLSESFGLPLIEAAEAGCEIIAANLAYVRDVIEPLVTFNPNEVEDLVRCIEEMEWPSAKRTTLKVRNEIDQLISSLSLYV